MWLKLLFITLIVVLVSSCSLFQNGDNQDYSKSYMDLNLSELAGDRNAEYSSLTWYGDELILLPQYPSYFRSKLGKDVIFSLNRKDLAKSIRKKGKTLLEPKQIEVVNNQTYKFLPGYEGFEGICTDGEFLYLSIEFSSEYQKGAIVKARLSDDKSSLLILNNEHILIDLPSDVFNASYESIFFFEDYLYVIYEANGFNINKNHIVKKISKDFEIVEDIPFPTIEYRITDISSFDYTGRGWAINYFWPGDASHYLPDEDTIINPFPASNNEEFGIERIIPLILRDNKIEYDISRDPIYIKKDAREVSYNWEGIVKYDNNSFLLVTDKFPQTLLRYLKK